MADVTVKTLAEAVEIKTESVEIKAKEEDSFSRDLEMLKFFQEEFIYRHKRYWDLLMKSFLLTIVVTVIPIFSSIFDIQMKELPLIDLLFFPLLGIFIAFLSYRLLDAETNRMNAVNQKKYEVNLRMNQEYQYSNIGNSGTKKGIANSTIKMITGLEILVAVAVIVILISNYGASVPPAA